MRALIAIGAAALCGLGALAPAAAAPGADAARASIRTLEQQVIEADRAIATARTAERRAADRLAKATGRLARATKQLSTRASAHRAGQAVLAERLRDIYRDGDADPLLTVFLSSGGLAALASEQAGAERTAREDARLVARLRADRREVALIERDRSREEAIAREARDEAASHRADLEGLRASRAAALAKARRVLARAEARERVASSRRERDARAAIAPGATTATTPRNGRWPAVPGGPSRAVLERIAQCESGGNPRSIGGGGQFRGKYQFMQSTWEAMGGTGDPAAATEAEQDYRAAVLFVKWGAGQWPVCAAFAR
ncbi:MAG: transglycosylase family protein [Actinomycetota bacterium]